MAIKFMTVEIEDKRYIEDVVQKDVQRDKGISGHIRHTDLIKRLVENYKQYRGKNVNS